MSGNENEKRQAAEAAEEAGKPEGGRPGPVDHGGQGGMASREQDDEHADGER